MINAIDLAFTLLEALLVRYGKQLPADLVASSQAAIDAWVAHKDDPITKANLEAQRG